MDAPERKADPKRTGLRARRTVFDFVAGLFPEAAEPGTYELYEGNMVLACPGCGALSALPLDGAPGHWTMTGAPAVPTLSPAVHYARCCGWQGRLTAGVFHCR